MSNQTHQAVKAAATPQTTQSRSPRTHRPVFDLRPSITIATSSQHTRMNDKTISSENIPLGKLLGCFTTPYMLPVPIGTTTRLKRIDPNHISHFPDVRARGWITAPTINGGEIKAKGPNTIEEHPAATANHLNLVGTRSALKGLFSK